MGGLTVGELCRRHQRIGLDSNVLIYVIESVPPWDRVAAELVNAVEAGATRATVSAVGLAEIVSGPAHDGEVARMERYEAELRSLPGLSIAPMRPELRSEEHEA